MKSLSACFLTRNEEATIERAVRSVKGVADEVIVADTHSDDRTAEIAAAAGATVVQFTWGDDFAAGRDYTIRQARGDWILWLHGSEELMPEGHAALRECLGREDAFGFFVRIQNMTTDAKPQADVGELNRAAETADLRLFRRRPDLPRLFVGRLHPHFHPAVLDVVRREGLQVTQSDIVVRHYADPSPRNASKLRFNLRLLEAELNDRPGQLSYLIEYGRTLLMMDDPKGHQVLAQAAEEVMALRDLPSPPSMKVQVLLNYLLTVPPDQSKSRVTFEDARDLAARWFSSSPGVLWIVAEQSFRRRDYAAAAEQLQRLLHLGRIGGYDRSQRFDPRILGADALLNLGACYLQMQRLDEAEACFLQLTTHPQFGQQASRMLGLAQTWRAGRKK
jgi:tetratricopeptide (TPR) repeat protein